MPKCDLCDGDLEDARVRSIFPQDNHGRPIHGVQSVSLMICDFCCGEFSKPNSPARKRFDGRFLRPPPN